MSTHGIALSGRSSQSLGAYSGRMSTVRLTPATMLATIVIPGQNSSHRWRPKKHRSSGHHVGFANVCSATAGASTLSRVTLSVGASIKITMVSII